MNSASAPAEYKAAAESYLLRLERNPPPPAGSAGFSRIGAFFTIVAIAATLTGMAVLAVGGATLWFAVPSLATGIAILSLVAGRALLGSSPILDACRSQGRKRRQRAAARTAEVL